MTKLLCTGSTAESVFTEGKEYDFSHKFQMVRSNGGYSYQVDSSGILGAGIMHVSDYGVFQFVEAE